MTAQTTAIPAAQMTELERLYSFRGRDEVINFIEQHPTLVPVLLEAPAKIAEYFPVQKLYLDVVFDTESEALDTLYVNMVTSLDVKTAMAIEDRFYDEWGMAAIDRVAHKLLFAERSTEVLPYL